jgi:hypothetical protein
MIGWLVGGALRFGQILSATHGVTTQEDGSVGWTISRDRFHNPCVSKSFLTSKAAGKFSFSFALFDRRALLRKLAVLLGRP